MNNVSVGEYVNIVYSITGSVKAKQIKMSDIVFHSHGSSKFTPITITEELMLKMGFTKNKSIILDSYTIDVSLNKLEYKVLSVNIEQGNQYIHIRQGNLNGDRCLDDVVTLYNSDYSGELHVHTIQRIYKSLTNKILNL